jgi:hypothetical protein
MPNNTITHNDNKLHSDVSKYRHNLRGKKGKCPPPQYFLYLRIIFFLVTELKRGQIKKLG